MCNRTADKAAALCAHEPARLRPAGFDPDTLRREAAECGLLVNCTSLGMEGAAGQFEEFSFLDALPAGAPVVDLIYAPAETELLRRAREGGTRPPTASDCWSTRRCSPWSTSPARPSTPRR